MGSWTDILGFDVTLPIRDLPDFATELDPGRVDHAGTRAVGLGCGPLAGGCGRSPEC